VTPGHPSEPIGNILLGKIATRCAGSAARRLRDSNITKACPTGRSASPREAIALDQALLDRPQSLEIQLDLFGDYKNNLALYPKFQEFFRTYRPPTLAVWGRHDPFFLPAGAEAYRRDNPKAKVIFYDTGHFALETHAAEIGREMRAFLEQNL
jgi:pimeloyl-ACP methyl ester carboxylesterase